MSGFRATVLRACAVLLLASLVAACALPQRGAFSGTKVNFNAYPQSRVGLLPIAINPEYPSNFPIGGVRDAVTKALVASLSLHPVALPRDAAVAAEAMFPLTPERLSKLAELHEWDGLVGISVASWSVTSRGDGHDRVHVDLTISYADHRSPRGQWTVTGTWSARTAEALPDKIEYSLPILLLDMRVGLTALSPRGLFLERTADQPQLTYIAPDEDSLALAPQLVTPRKYVDLYLTSIDDPGLRGMEVVNERAAFRWTLEGVRDHRGEYPIFLASKVRVPLEHAENKILLKATPAAGSRKEALREFSISSTGQHEFFALPIGVDSYRYVGAVQGAAAGARELAQAARAYSSAPFDQLTDAQVTLPALDAVLRTSAEHLSVRDTVLLSFAGRAVPLGSAVFLALPDIDPSKPSGSFLRAEDLLRQGSSLEMVLLLDLCSDADDLPWVRRYLQAAIPQEQSALVRLADCSVPLGGLATAAARALERHTLMSGERYRGGPFFSDFVRLVQSGRYAGQEGAAWTDIVFRGDGSLPTLVTTDWIHSHKERGFFGNLLGLPPPPAVEPQPTTEPSEYYVIASSTASEDDAMREAKRRGPNAIVVQGTSGFFGVAIGQAKDARSANEKLREALVRGEVSYDAFVLPRSRVQRLIP